MLSYNVSLNATLLVRGVEQQPACDMRGCAAVDDMCALYTLYLLLQLKCHKLVFTLCRYNETVKVTLKAMRYRVCNAAVGKQLIIKQNGGTNC